MVTLLLIIIYIVFISLGIPDSILGTAWPAIYKDLNFPIGYQSVITTIISLSTILSSFFAPRIINKFGTGKVTVFSVLLTALALLGFSKSQSIYVLCLMAIPSGLGAGAIDAALNNYVALHYKPSQMSFLHCFYGVGVAVSPYILSFTLNGAQGWRNGYFVLFLIQLFIAVIAFIALPLWKKVKTVIPKDEVFTPVTLSYGQMLKDKTIKIGWLLFFSTCALEFTCGAWGASYLVVHAGLDKSFAAKFTTLYYIGITSGRFISGLVANKVKVKYILCVGYTLVGTAILILLLPLPATVKGISLFMIGLGNGPTFPNLTHLTPKKFGKEVSQSIVASWLIFANAGVLIAPALFGLIAQFVSVSAFSVYCALLYMLMLFATLSFNARLKKYRNISL